MNHLKPPTLKQAEAETQAEVMLAYAKDPNSVQGKHRTADDGCWCKAELLISKEGFWDWSTYEFRIRQPSMHITAMASVLLAHLGWQFIPSHDNAAGRAVPGKWVSETGAVIWEDSKEEEDLLRECVTDFYKVRTAIDLLPGDRRESYARALYDIVVRNCPKDQRYPDGTPMTFMFCEPPLFYKVEAIVRALDKYKAS